MYFSDTFYLIATNGTLNACIVLVRNLCPNVVPAFYLLLLLNNRETGPMRSPQMR